MVRKKGFLTKVSEFVMGEPVEVTKARQKAFTDERKLQAQRVGREKARIEASAQLRRERSKFTSQGTRRSAFSNPPPRPRLSNIPIRTTPRRRRTKRRRVVRGAPTRLSDSFVDVVGF